MERTRNSGFLACTQVALRVSVCSNFFLSHSNGGVSSGFESNGSELLPSLSTYEQGGELAEPSELYWPYL